MIELGKVQSLRIVKKKEAGFIAKDRVDMRQVFIPARELEDDIELGDEVEVFVYKNMNGDMVGSSKSPTILPGELKELEVVDVTKFGAFLDWGMDKDLLLPSKKQLGHLRKGDKCFVGLYFDSKERICATMDLYRELKEDSEYKANDTAKGVVYDIKDEMGVLVAVDNKYHGLIPKHEVFENYKRGQELDLRITKVREDGKLYVSPRKMAYQQMDSDSQLIYEALKLNEGFLSVNDKSDPELIKLKFGMSKKAFKRAIGRLLKEKKIAFENDGIKML